MALTLGVDLLKMMILPKLFPKNHFDCDKRMKTIYSIMFHMTEMGLVELRKDYGTVPYFFVPERGIKHFRREAKKYIRQRGAPVRNMLEVMMTQEEEDTGRMVGTLRIPSEALQAKYADLKTKIKVSSEFASSAPRITIRESD